MLAGVTFVRGYFSLRFAAVSGGAPTLMQAVIQFSDRYVMAAALEGMPLAPHLRLPGDYPSPWGAGGVWTCKSLWEAKPDTVS